MHARCFTLLLGVWLVTVASLPAAQTTAPPPRSGATGYVGDEAQRKLGEPLPPRTSVTPAGIDPLRAARPQPPAPGPAIVIPRESCGTHWTAWLNDPNADANPCPANCKRGKRVQLNQHKSGNVTQYEANYECYLPELEIRPAPGARPLAAAGAAPRKNCGTAWTGWQSDPYADMNPCPANCERGELRRVNRNRSGDKLRYDMNYQCYVKERESALVKQAVAQPKPGPSGGIKRPRAAFRAKAITTEAMQLTGKRRPAFTPQVVSTESMQLTGIRRSPPRVITTESIQLAGMRRAPFSSKSIVTEPLQLTGNRPPSLPSQTDRMIKPGLPPGAPTKAR